MKAVFLTAGAAGMFCGSCMHDNSLARALRVQGVDCLLQPVYTPIRTDAESVADRHVFFGGIHIYLLQQLPWLRWMPAPVRRALDWPPLIRLAARRSHSTDARKLAQLTISMLRGVKGNQADEMSRLVEWFASEMKPDAIVLSNLLIGGALPEIRRRLPNTRLVVLLQGDDIFLEYLPQPEQDQAIALCRQLVGDVDRFVVNSKFYAAKMGAMLEIPDRKMIVTPLSIDTAPFAPKLPGCNATTSMQAGDPVAADTGSDATFRLGYLARVAPEKGLHQLVDAFIDLAGQPGNQDVTLHAAGWLGKSHHDYFQLQLQKIKQANLDARFTYHGSPDLDQKISFLRGLDLLCVPTDYEEPKGLFVLEALAAGVPVVLPDHGAFGELIESTGGGVVVQPRDVGALCEAITRLKTNPDLRRELAIAGSAAVYEKHCIESAALQMKQILFDG